MKKLTFTVLLISVLQVLNAQEIQSKFIVGGSLNFLIQNNAYPLPIRSINPEIGGVYSYSSDDIKDTKFAIIPYLGKEISQKFFVGLQLDYRFTRFKLRDIHEWNSNRFGIGLFTRHILNPDNQLSFFIQPYMEYNLRNEEYLQDSNVTREEKAHYYELGAGFGVFYNINKNVRAILRTGGVNYVNGKREFKDTDTKNDFSSFGINLNLSTIFFGFELRI